MTIREYFKEWEGFDYCTEMSDDYSVVRRGQREKIRLAELAKGDPILEEICVEFMKADTPWYSHPKPKLEDFIEENT